MLDYDKLIEKMAKAICWSQNYSFTEDDKMLEFMMHQPYYIDSAKAVLEALQDELPYEHQFVDYEHFNELRELYSQLKTLGRYLQFINPLF